MIKTWSVEEIQFLRDNYSTKGLEWSAEALGRSRPSIRMKASRLGLRQDQNSEFFQDWQTRAAQSKVGKKRPEQALVMLQNHADGKMKMTDERKRGISKRTKKWIAKNGHPRGALGMKHSDEAKKAVGRASKEMWANMTEEERIAREFKRAKTAVANGTNVRPRQKASWKAGWRTVGGIRKYYRSKWEANYAYYLEWLKSLGEIQSWEHEPDTFWFEGVKRGCVSYLPDFKVINCDDSIEYHEVKGWMDARSKTKIKRMAKYHPDVKLIVIAAKEYKSIKRTASAMVPGWEA